MRLIVLTNIIAIILILAGCQNQNSNSNPAQNEEKMHEEHLKLADNLAHQGIAVLKNKADASREFSQQIETFFSSYLRLEDALVNSDSVAANNAAEEMRFLLEMIPDPSTDSVAITTWLNHQSGYYKNLTEFLHTKELEMKRSYFSHITEFLYCTFKSFNIDGLDVHVAYCPMAFEEKGAYWLTDSHKIRNPYFGAKMLDCGSITEMIP
jgi:superoxide dismutase